MLLVSCFSLSSLVMSCLIFSYLISSHIILSYLMPCHIIIVLANLILYHPSHPVLSCLKSSCLISSCHLISTHLNSPDLALSCLTLSYLVLSYHNPSHLVLSYPNSSHFVLSHFVFPYIYLIFPHQPRTCSGRWWRASRKPTSQQMPWLSTAPRRTPSMCPSSRGASMVEPRPR